MQAIILAAGMGRRLGELTKDNTKCMVCVNGVSLIDRTLSHAAKVSSSRVGTANPDLAERENTSHAEKVATSKVAMKEIENHGENSAEEEIQEGQENLGETGSRGFRRRKRNKRL